MIGRGMGAEVWRGCGSEISLNRLWKGTASPQPAPPFRTEEREMSFGLAYPGWRPVRAGRGTALGKSGDAVAGVWSRGEDWTRTRQGWRMEAGGWQREPGGELGAAGKMTNGKGRSRALARKVDGKWGDRAEKQKAKGRTEVSGQKSEIRGQRGKKKAGATNLRRAGSTTDGKDVRRDHTLKAGDALSAPQSCPILWWLDHVVMVSTKTNIATARPQRWRNDNPSGKKPACSLAAHRCRK